MLQSSPKEDFMLFKATLIELSLFSIFTILIFTFLREFKILKRRVLVFIFPLFTYVVGFSLRLTGDKELVDLGFFFTEFSTIFVTVLFSLSLYLGQIRYWRIK
ncbi:hypothetical protein HZB97_00455 [Candidatus Gottesmanbacteria bacterium]|nr:hypothetical protein [Candidatus Gottesmanbacteria bacterium]MBI5465425.1 hypothetical protein [Candidatus Gottesmanbacteria bacterium]